MPLILTSPNASPVRTYKSGVKVIRLHEFLGPARGTLSTESDPLSLCGTVIRDTQTVSYAGTRPNKTILSNIFTEGDPTIVMSESDLGLRDAFIYAAFLSCRCEGDTILIEKNSTHNWLEVGAKDAAVVAAILDSDGDQLFETSTRTAHAPRPETNPFYKLIWMGTGIFNAGLFTEGGTYFSLKAASGAGGAFEWLLDCLYLVPIAAWEPDGPYEDDMFRIIMPTSEFEPVYDLTSDTYDNSGDDSIVDWLGQYSVMYNAPDGFSCGIGPVFADYQEGDDENTTGDVSGVSGPARWLADPSSTITIATGSHFVPDHNIDSDSFNRTVSPAISQNVGTSDNDRVWMIFADDPSEASGPNNGFGCDGSHLIFGDSKFNDLFPEFFPTVGNESERGDAMMLALGSHNQVVGASPTDEGHHVLSDLTHATMQVKVSTNHILCAGFQMFLGFISSGTGNIMAVVADIPSQYAFGARGTAPLNAGLIFFPNHECDRGEFSGPISGTLTQTYVDGPTEINSAYVAGEWINLKIEMQWYTFRAKAWMDGDSEPDWMFEGEIPSEQQDTNEQNILYPWDDPDDGTFGASRRSLNSVPYPLLGVRYFRAREDTTGNSTQFSVNPIRVTTTSWDDFVIDHESHGATPSDVHFKMEKYDENIDYGEVVIGPENQRMVIATPARYTFNGDEDGVIMTVWKEEGAPDTQASVIARTIQREILRGPIDLDLKFRPWEQNDID